MQEAMIKRAIEFLENETVDRVLGWKTGEYGYDNSPSVFTCKKELEEGFVYNAFCGANLSKMLFREASKGGKILVFLKPCDTYSFNQLVTEHRINCENVYVIGVGCSGTIDMRKVTEMGITGVTDVVDGEDTVTIKTVYGDKEIEKSEIYCERCLCCKGKEHKCADEIIGESKDIEPDDRFDMVSKLENMTADERFEFWRGELSRCIRCNACRNACPACTCEKCVFDNPESGVENTAIADSFEENMFHIIRAFHVSGRCTDCGECSRVCPEHIPLHLLNRKFIKDIDEFYGEYQAGDEIDQRSPLVSYTQGDPEPSIVKERGVK